MLALFLTPVALARPALAQDQGTIDKLVQLNKKAMDDYDTADFDTAKKALLDAEKTGKRAGLESHPVMARTYVHLGALYLIGYKDKQKAQHYFGKAFDIQPDIRLDKTLTSPAVRDLFASVKARRNDSSSPEADLFPPSSGGGSAGRNAGSTGGAQAPATGDGDGETAAPEVPALRRRQAGRPAEAEVEPELPAAIAALDCPAPDDTPPGKKVILRCAAAPNLGVAGVALYYKGHQMTNYERVEMFRSPKGWWQATVPKKRVDGTSLQFYFEGLDASDKPVVSSGRAESPNVMLIVDHGNQGAAGAGDVDENPLEEGNRASPRLLLGKYDDSRVGVDKRFGNRRFWIGLGAGTGIVYAINGVPESHLCGLGNGTAASSGNCDGGFPAMSHSLQVTGIGWARIAHLVPEIGFQITPDWAISIEGRNQWILQSKKVAGYTASGAHSVLLKVVHYTKQQQLRVFYGAVGGGGEGVRMGIQTDPAMNPDLWDTIRVGGVLLGATGGVNYEISKRFTWTAGVNGLFGFPKQGLTFDLNTGIHMNFGDTSGAAEAAAAKKASSVSTSIDDEEPK